jgi:hypothetical protein
MGSGELIQALMRRRLIDVRWSADSPSRFDEEV